MVFSILAGPAELSRSVSHEAFTLTYCVLMTWECLRYRDHAFRTSTLQTIHSCEATSRRRGVFSAAHAGGTSSASYLSPRPKLTCVAFGCSSSIGCANAISAAARWPSAIMRLASALMRVRVALDVMWLGQNPLLVTMAGSHAMHTCSV